MLPHVDTGVDRATLDAVFEHFTDYPEGFTPHPKLARQFDARSKLYHEQGQVEWATAELLAFGSLVLEGIDRCASAGEDSRRGTFSQRHASLVDYETGKTWVPIATLAGKKAQVLGVRLAAVGVRRPSGSSTATRWPRRTRSCCGRPSSATS